MFRNNFKQHILNKIHYLIPWLLLLSAGPVCAQAPPSPIAGIDDTPNTQWQGQTAHGAFFGVANITESSQPYTHTTDGRSIRFDLGCGTAPCSYGRAEISNPSYGTSSATDAATTITDDLLAELDSVGVSGSQALEFGVDQSMCTANCGTSSAQYTRFRYAMQCDFKDTGLWRVWDASSGWVATSHNCVAFTALNFVHFTFHFARPDASHVQYTDLVINGVTYSINLIQAAQSLGATSTHQFTPWTGLDGDSTTDPYSLWVDQWSITYAGGSGSGGGGLIPAPPSTAVHLANLDDDPISSTPTTPAIGTWGDCTTSACNPTAPAQSSLTRVAKPSVDGNALDAFDSGNAFWGILFYHKNGQQDFATNYEVEWQFQIDTAFSNVQALEFDFPASINHLWYYFGTQCVRGGMWQIWNPNSTNHGWHNTTVPCQNFTANQFHTIRWYGNRTSSSFTYVALEVDGKQFSINATMTAPSTSWDDEFIVQFQPDGDSAGTGYNMYVDTVNAWLW